MQSNRNKYSTIAFLCCLFFSGGVYSQKNTITAGLHTNFSNYSNEFQMMELCFDSGYNFTDKFFMNLRFENAVALFTIDNVDKNYVNGIYGINVGYKFLEFDPCTLDARVGFGDGLTRKMDWNYNYYYAEVNLYMGNMWKVKPSFGFGIKYYNSQNDIYKDYTRVFMSLGFTIN